MRMTRKIVKTGTDRPVYSSFSSINWHTFFFRVWSLSLSVLLSLLRYMYNYVEMARVTGVPLNFLLTRGQSIKVFSQILRKARSKGLLVPALKGGGQQDGVAFEGATVLEAKSGYVTNSSLLS